VACRAQAVIMVTSGVSLVDGVRAQATITNATGLGEQGVLNAIAIKEIQASILIRDLGPIFGDSQEGTLGGALTVAKRQLSAFQAYGAGDPQGWPQPPITDPSGPWFGLVWPYRDQYDYFPAQFDPLGDDVGIPFFDDPDVYGFINIDGIARGGPTDPVSFPDQGGGPSSPEWLLRGVTGNGLTGPASYFAFDISSNLQGTLDHLVRLRIFAAQAIVVVQEGGPTGPYSEILVPIPDFEITFPEPATALLAAPALVSILGIRARRR
jgi:hypothetical protein